MDEPGFLVVFANCLVASEAVESQVSLSFGSGLGLRPLEQSKAETLPAVGAFDGDLECTLPQMGGRPRTSCRSIGG